MAHRDLSKMRLDENIHPAKIDMPWRHHILKPDVSADWIVKDEDISAGGTITCTVDIANCDYPRNLLVTQTDNAAADLATVTTIVGLDQFGKPVTEVFTIAAGDTTATGEKIFSTVTSVTVVCTDAAASDLLDVGFDITSTTAVFGLPVKIGAYTDIKSILWIDAGVAKNIAVASGRAVVAYSAFLPGQTIAAADDYIVTFKPSLESLIRRQDANTAYD